MEQGCDFNFRSAIEAPLISCLPFLQFAPASVYKMTGVLNFRYTYLPIFEEHIS